MRPRIQILFMFFCIIALFSLVNTAFAATVSESTALQVAQNLLKSHIAVHGEWNGSTNPTVGNIDVVTYQNMSIAYQVNINPTGHMLVAYYDDFSPVLFYSPSSDFDPSKVDDPNAIESWLMPEIYGHVNMLVNGVMPQATGNHAIHALSTADKYSGDSGMKIANAWQMLGQVNFTPAKSSVHALALTAGATNSTVGPLLHTTWNQGMVLPTSYTNYPYGINEMFIYNLYTPSGPAENGYLACTHTFTGCVATAMAQVMKYWNWPDSGVGSNSYQWKGTTLSANFAHSYDWANMPNILIGENDSTQQLDAIDRLMSDVGIAIKMNYACAGSGAWPADAVTAFYTNFKYAQPQLIDRKDYAASAWVSTIENELNASTPRPIMFTIYTTGYAGHEVVIDGYQKETTGTDQVHINYGWGGHDDGYYDITNNWVADYTWTINGQELVIGIQPTTYTLTVANFGSGSVTADKGSLTASGTTETGTYYGGTKVTLTATPAAGDTFTGWGGACSGTGTCVLSIAANTSVTATFASANTSSYSISGTVTSSGTALSGVSVALSGTKALITTTDSSGNYSFTGLANGSYTVVASKAGYTFSPATSVLSVSNKSLTGQNFTGTQTTYTVTPSAGSGGSISPSTPQTVSPGATQSFTFTPHSGYTLSGYSTTCGGSLSGSTFTTGAVSSNCSVSASFRINTYTIAATAGTGGSISPAGVTTVNYGGSQTYTISASTGYSISNVVVDGVSKGAISTYTFSNVTANHTISATFQLSTYTVTPLAGQGGSFAPSTPQTVVANKAFSISVTPNSGYYIVSVSGCGNSLGSSNSAELFVTAPVTSNCTISAQFAPLYTITASAGTGGNISSSGLTRVRSGGSQSYTITPASGYTASVVVDGKSVTLGNNTYTFSNVPGNHTIVASFTKNTSSK
ncbi:MAG: C10 family peptidase [Nitrospirae bacterium]|nr:C10 family peptidase [Nitrospirota bacterium]